MHVAEEDISLIEKRAIWSHKDSSPITRLARECYLQSGRPLWLSLKMTSETSETSEYGFECSSWELGVTFWDLRSEKGFKFAKNSN